MDQGTASVLGAVVAVAGVLVTAWLTYRASRRQPRDQGDVDHGRTLREERRAAYEGFIAAAAQIDQALREFDPRRGDFHRSQRPWLPAPSAAGRCVEHLAAASRDLGEVKTKSELAGPDSVAKSADDVWRSVTTLHDQLKAWNRVVGAGNVQRRKTLGRLARDMETSRQRFAKRSRAALAASR
jgi:hypothetical protein